MNEEEMNKRESESTELKVVILMHIVKNKMSVVNALAALSTATGTLLAGMTIGMNDEERQKAIEAALALDGPLVKSVRIAIEGDLNSVRRFDAAKASSAQSPAPANDEPRWGNL